LPAEKVSQPTQERLISDSVKKTGIETLIHRGRFSPARTVPGG